MHPHNRVKFHTINHINMNALSPLSTFESVQVAAQANLITWSRIRCHVMRARINDPRMPVLPRCRFVCVLLCTQVPRPGLKRCLRVCMCVGMHICEGGVSCVRCEHFFCVCALVCLHLCGCLRVRIYSCVLCVRLCVSGCVGDVCVCEWVRIRICAHLCVCVRINTLDN